MIADTPSHERWDDDDPTPLKKSVWDVPTPRSHSGRDAGRSERRSERSERRSDTRPDRDRKRYVYFCTSVHCTAAYSCCSASQIMCYWLRVARFILVMIVRVLESLSRIVFLSTVVYRQLLVVQLVDAQFSV